MSDTLADVHSSTHPSFVPVPVAAEPAKRPAAAGPVVVGDAAALTRKAYTKAMRKRRSIPIMGYTGNSGHGKSASMIRDTLPDLAFGRPILSTVEILDAHTGNAHPLWIPFSSFRQLEDFHDGVVLMDEITAVMDSHEGAMPKRVRRKLPQLRRSRVFVRWSGIDWDNSNRRLRQMTQAVTVCRGYFPKQPKAAHEEAIAMWAPRRLFRLRTYDAQKLMRTEDSARLVEQSLTLAKGPKVRTPRPSVLVKERWWGPGSLVFDSYRTMGDVLSVDSSCEICGGKVTEKICRGHGDTH